MPPFIALENGLTSLGTLLGIGHERYPEYVALRDHLKNNITRARRDDTKELRTERKQAIVRLNRLTLNTARRGFNKNGLTDPPKEVVVLLINLAVVGLAVLATTFFREAVILKWLPCRYPLITASCLVMLAAAGIHMIWRWACSRSEDLSIKCAVIDIFWVFTIKLPIASILDELHPWTRSNRVVYKWGIVLIAFAVILLWVSPAPHEPPPRVEAFSVKYPTNETVSLGPSDLSEGIEVRAGDSIVVKAETGENPNVHCTWYADSHGKLPPDEGKCDARYRAPLDKEYDSVTVQVQSPCRTCETWASVPIEIVSP
jgi:hypothetical protein